MMDPTQYDSSKSDPRIGRLLAEQYRIDSVLGKGGMGTVYRGVQLSLNRAVAIKLISHEGVDNPEFVRRFRREAELMSKLEHPFIVRLYDFGVTDDGVLYLVMELLQGADLSVTIEKGGPMSVERALNICTRVFNALRQAHSLGIVHRDLKPHNLFMSTDEDNVDTVKIMDFGIARPHAADTKLTSTGTILGTPAYMSPEQAQGQEVDARADLYSMGIILFELLTGRCPFVAPTAVSMLMKHISEAPPRLSGKVPALAQHPELQDFLDKLLAKSPTDRPASAGKAAELTQALLAGTHSVDPTAEAPTTTPTPGTLADANPTEAVPSTKGRSKKLPLIAAAVGVVFFAGGGLFFSTCSKDERNETPPVAAAPAAAPVAAAEADPIEIATIASNPAGARVLLNGAELGVTPYELRFRKATQLVVQAEGYQAAVVQVDPGGEPTYVATLVAVPGQPAGGRRRSWRARSASVSSAPAAAAPAAGAPAPAAPRKLTHAEFYATIRSQNQNARRDALQNHGPRFKNVFLAKRALGSGQVDKQEYKDNIWVLKEIRKQAIYKAEAKYRAGTFTRPQFAARRHEIDVEYVGP